MENLLEVSDDRKKQSKQKFWKAQIEIVIGAFLYTVPYNLIITPMGLYNGYMTGIAQIIKTILVRLLGIPVLFDWTGIILLGLNIPLFLMAYRSIGKRFFLETVFTVLLQTVFFSVIPVRAAPLIQDKLTACLVAGCVSGIGVGIILRSGSSGGGIDIIGMYMLKKNPNSGVGKVSMAVASFVFLYCLIFFQIETVVYSAIFTIAGAVVIDRVHEQNIKMTVVIITKLDYIGDLITCSLRRSATCWEGRGVYSMDTRYVYITAVSKYEAEILKREIQAIDSDAFVIFQKVQSVEGHYESHIEN